MDDGLMKSENAMAYETKQLGVMEQLIVKKEHLAGQMAEIDSTIAMFEKHPEFEQCLTQLARVGIHR